MTRSQQVNDIFDQFTEVFEILTPFFGENKSRMDKGISGLKINAEFKSLTENIVTAIINDAREASYAV